MSWSPLWAGLLIGVCLLTGGWSPADRTDASAGGERFARLAEAYLDWYFAAHPVRATRLGIHRHDSELPDMSRSGIERRAAESRLWLERLLAIDPVSLDRDSRFDHRILEHAIRAELLELEEIQSWRHNPLAYSRLAADGIATILEQVDDPRQRIEALTLRLEALPDALAMGRENLETAPGLWTALAARGARGTAQSVREELALLRGQARSLPPAARRAWESARRQSAEALERFAEWLEHDLALRPAADFRLGRELFERKLLYEEHLALSVEQLQTMNQRAIHYYREWLAREAAVAEPGLPVASVMKRIVADHPAPETLLRAAEIGIEQARRLVAEKDLVGLPVSPIPEVRATPRLAGSAFASMSAPGPFASGAVPAFYNVTNVDPSWSPREQDEHLSYFNYPSLLGIAVHEVMPGHFVQQSWRRRLPSDVRRVFLPPTVVEGWAHYVEQMMVDEGLGDGDPTIRLAQLRRALQRHARWDVGLGLHARGMSFDQAIARFRDIAYFPEFPAAREVQRATYDPTYLYYALGRMQILELREDYRRYVERRGGRFSLREFHDRFLGLGLPIPLAREAMMPEDDRSTG